jgi:electron transport complex protein RnfB
MLQAVLWIGGIGLLLGLLIGIANIIFEVKEEPIVVAVYDLLPHFNCGACGTPGCLANAKEIVHNNQPLTSCKPGDQQMRNAIKKVLDDYKSGVLTFDDN